MQLTYHLILSEEALATLGDWPQWCQSEGITIDLAGADQIPSISQKLWLNLDYQGVSAKVQSYREEIDDVKDVCDDLTMYLQEEHALSLNFHIEAEQTSLYLLTMALAIAVFKSNGLCYIEGDGRFIKPAEALAEAKAIQAAFN